MNNSEAINILKDAGIVNPLRLVDLIHESISFMKLDLSRLVVLTEAASQNYVHTPVIAALAGAEKVLALSVESKYASIGSVIKQTRALEFLCDVSNEVEIITERSNDLFSQADIVTNLGFVRPIDNDAINAMKPTGVISLMSEPWEIRKDDIDIPACKGQNIIIVGTNEDAEGLKVFDYSKTLILKMLFEVGLEVYQDNYLIISEDKFGDRIYDSLVINGADVTLCGLDNVPQKIKELKKLDGIIVADYTCKDIIIGERGILKPKDIRSIHPNAIIIQFAGIVKTDELKSMSIPYYPSHFVGPNRMGQTFGFLGAKPIVKLHAAGLKAGEVMARLRLEPSSLSQVNEKLESHELISAVAPN